MDIAKLLRNRLPYVAVSAATVVAGLFSGVGTTQAEDIHVLFPQSGSTPMAVHRWASAPVAADRSSSRSAANRTNAWTAGLSSSADHSGTIAMGGMSVIGMTVNPGNGSCSSSDVTVR